MFYFRIWKYDIIHIMKVKNKAQAIILLIILIAIGGVVMYSSKPTPKLTPKNITTMIKGPATPPPGYAASR